MPTASEVLTTGAPPANTNGAVPPALPEWANAIQNPDVKAWLGEKKYESPEVLASSAYSLERLYGADKAGRTAILPKDEKDVEGLKAFNAKIGVPDTADGYKLPFPEGADDGFAKTAAGWFHEAGVPAKGAAKVAEKWNAWVAEQVKAGEAADKAKAEQDLTALRGEWGAASTEREEFARRGLRGIGKEAGLNDADLATLEASLGTAKMLKVFWKLGETMKEGGFAGGGNDNFGMSPAAAQTEIDKITADRQAGKITDYDWKSGKPDGVEARFLKLGAIVAGQRVQ